MNDKEAQARLKGQMARLKGKPSVPPYSDLGQRQAWMRGYREIG